MSPLYPIISPITVPVDLARESTPNTLDRIPEDPKWNWRAMGAGVYQVPGLGNAISVASVASPAWTWAGWTQLRAAAGSPAVYLLGVTIASSTTERAISFGIGDAAAEVEITQLFIPSGVAGSLYLPSPIAIPEATRIVARAADADSVSSFGIASRLILVNQADVAGI